jgi:hypothetical protein
MVGREVEVPQAGDAEAGICTETLARLYLQQGFVARALAMYRRLAQEQPENHQLQECRRTLERQLALGALGQDAVVQRTIPDLAVDTTSTALLHQGESVVAQLERWLHALRRQRQHQERP